MVVSDVSMISWLTAIYLLDDCFALLRRKVVVELSILIGETQNANVVNGPGLGSLLIVRAGVLVVQVVNHDNIRLLHAVCHVDSELVIERKELIEMKV
jgi:hypothetical protein